MFRHQHHCQRRLRGHQSEARLLSHLWETLEPTRCFSKPTGAVDLDRQGEFLLVANTKVSISILQAFHPTRAESEKITPVAAQILAAGTHKSISAAKWYAQDTGMFFTAGREGSVAVWDTNAGIPAVVFSSLFEKAQSVRNIAPSVMCDKHTLLAVAANHRDVVVCDVRVGSMTLRLSYHERGGVQGVQWSPVAEFMLATSGDDNAILLWDIRKTRKPIQVLNPSTASRTSNETQLVFAPHGRTLASLGVDGRIALWDCLAGRRLTTHYPRLQPDERFRRDMAFVTHGAREILLAPSVNNTHMFDVWTGTLIKKLVGHYGVVEGVFAHPRIPEMYTYSNDDGVLAWTLPDPRAPVVAGPAAAAAAAVVNDEEDAWSVDEEDVA